MKKKLLVMLLTVAVAVGMLPASVFAGVTTAKTPDGVGNTSLKWSYDFQSGGMDFSKAPTVPALIGGALYVGSADKVYKFNKDTGKILATSVKLPGRMGWATTPLIGDDSGIYVFVTGARVVKLSPDLKKILWSGKVYDGQNITPLKKIGDRIYGGTWGDSKDGGTFFCLNANTGKTIWTMYDSEGFYWAGAVENGGRVYFASDSSVGDKYGRKSVNIYSLQTDASTSEGAVVTNVENVKIRSTPAVDGEGNLYYTSMKADKTGALTKYSTNEGVLTKAGEFAMGTSSNTPIIDGDKIFVGDGNYLEGGAGRCIYVVNRNTMKATASANTPAPVQGEMLVAKGADAYRIYATYNNMPGGLFYVEMPLDATKVTEEGTTFLPIRRQYCISNVVCDDVTGTIYYKNDSGSIMAVKEGINTAAVTGVKAAASGANAAMVTWNGRENVNAYEVLVSKDGKTFSKAGSTTDTSLSVKNLPCGKTYSIKVRTKLLKGTAPDSAVVRVSTLPAAPSGVKAKNVKKKKAQVSWKKVTGAAGYTVYQSTSKSGKYKAVKTLNGAGKVKYTSGKLKKKKTYYYKVRAFVKTDGKKLYGGWSKVVSVKIKK